MWTRNVFSVCFEIAMERSDTRDIMYNLDNLERIISLQYVNATDYSKSRKYVSCSCINNSIHYYNISLVTL